MAESITITEALAVFNVPETDQGEVNYFSIKFIRTKGSRNGAKGSARTVSKGIKYIPETRPGAPKKRQAKRNPREISRLYFWDDDKKELVSCYTWSILEFNGKPVRK